MSVDPYESEYDTDDDVCPDCGQEDLDCWCDDEEYGVGDRCPSCGVYFEEGVGFDCDCGHD